MEDFSEDEESDFEEQEIPNEITATTLTALPTTNNNDEELHRLQDSVERMRIKLDLAHELSEADLIQQKDEYERSILIHRWFSNYEQWKRKYFRKYQPVIRKQ